MNSMIAAASGCRRSLLPQARPTTSTTSGRRRFSSAADDVVGNLIDQYDVAGEARANDSVDFVQVIVDQVLTEAKLIP
jgi:hypothetical protein